MVRDNFFKCLIMKDPWKIASSATNLKEAIVATSEDT